MDLEKRAVTEIMDAVTAYGRTCSNLLDFTRHQETPEYKNVQELVEKAILPADSEE